MGAHILSGAVMDPRALAELIPDFIAQGAPIECAVEQEAIYFLTEASDLRLPVVPPFLKNNGNLIISLGKLVQWLGERAEAAGVSLLTSTAGANLIIEAGQVRGVITDDKGLDREGRAGENDQPGYELRARVTVRIPWWRNRKRPRKPDPVRRARRRTALDPQRHPADGAQHYRPRRRV